MNSLPDAEQDACDAARALAGLAALLRTSDVESDDGARMLLALAEDGSRAVARVLAYLRELRGSGDGAAAAVPPRLGQWRDWVPPRGHLLSECGGGHRVDEVPDRLRRGDPGE